jgi:hypothetical protein
VGLTPPFRRTDRAARRNAEGLQTKHSLKTVYGYDAFRGPQARIVEHVIAGNNAFVLMPTGGGKSLCYQIPAIARPGMGLVVSPLLALMADQVTALRQAGVKAAALNSDLPPDERRALWRDIHGGGLDLLYVAPETLLRPDVLERLRWSEAVADRHRRGALPVAMGARFPPVLSPARRGGGALSRHAAHGADGDGRRADARGNPVASRHRRGPTPSSPASTGPTSATPSRKRTIRGRN